MIFLKRLFFRLKQKFSWKAYALLTLILFLVTVFRPEYPVRVAHTPFQYQYGIIKSWIVFYQTANLGMKPLWYQLLHPNAGILFSPQSLFLDSLVIYIGYLLVILLIYGDRTPGEALKRQWNKRRKSGIR